MKSIMTLCGVVLVAMLIGSCGKDSVPEAASSVSLHSELGGDATGFERACGPREFNFPVDHGAHREFRNEWWYITGNLQSSDNKKFGFHTTFFRVANRQTPSAPSAEQPGVTSRWASDEFYMGHFALTAADSDKVNAHERFARSAAGLAGAEVNESQNTVRVWLDDWQLIAEEKNAQAQWRLQLGDGDDALDLTLVAQKPLVLQGEDGYSQKSADPCNSSFYYSYTRLQASGEVQTSGLNHQVSGSAWLDREWSSSALADNQVGWDWFALQLDDGRDIMLYQLRNADGSVDPYSHAVEINEKGEKTALSNTDITLEVDQWWQSESGARYPVGGKIHRADNGEVISYRPLVNNQELNLTVRYWEGAITLSDSAGNPVGRGYLELTGY